MSDRFFTIPPGCDFATDLAKGVIEAAQNPLALARTQIFVPSRRASRALSSAFLAVSDGKAMMLPSIKAIGDVEDEAELAPVYLDGGSLPPAMPEMRRLCLIAAQVRAFPMGGEKPSEVQAFMLAQALIHLFDQVQNADSSMEELASFWPEELASHWSDIAQCLTILSQFWPQILAEEGKMDPVARRIALLHQQAEAWRVNPPQTPVIIAGSTGSLPATQRLMKVVANLPQGQIVLPGLMPDLSSDDWQAITQDVVHPMHPLASTLAALDVPYQKVCVWPQSRQRADDNFGRMRFLQEVLRPASQTDKWRDIKSDVALLSDKKTYQGFQRIDAQDSHEEAAIIALLLRRELEKEGHKAILVTPDRQLAKMVRSELRRFAIEIDDSAGAPLSQSAIGSYVMMLARLVSSTDIITDLCVLAGHPFSSGGMMRTSFRGQFDKLNIRHLRGTLTFSDLAGLQEHLKGNAGLSEFFDNHIAAHLADLLALRDKDEVSLGACAAILGRVAEIFAAEGQDETAISQSVQKCWAGPEGDAAASLLADLESFGSDFRLRPQSFALTLTELIQKTDVRKPYLDQSRLAILGAVEARMISADLVILAGLNEGIWPPKSGQDFWMNQSMAEAIGLPHKQWRIALSAHDFMMAASLPNIVLTRARRQNDRPTLPSRWLVRMDAVIQALQIGDLVNPDLPDDLVAILAQRKAIQPMPIAPPQPKPPLSHRPRRISATQFDTLMADPYALYASKILRLRSLPMINEPPGPALKGTLFHEALHEFVSQHPRGKLAEELAGELMSIAERHLAPYLHHYEVRYFWMPQIVQLAHWFISHDNAFRHDNAFSMTETKGEITIEVGERSITLSAKADRIIDHGDGTASIIDYKTGTIPTKKNVTNGRAAQMLVEAALLEKGGFSDTKNQLAAIALSYWKLRGRGAPPAEITDVLPKEFDAGRIFDAMVALVTRFEDEDMPYLSEPDPKGRPKYSDYRHLARIKEWRPQEADNE